LLPGLVSAGVGYLIFIGFGDWGGIAAQAITGPNLPAYEGTTIGDTPGGVSVGVVVALLVAGVRRVAVRVDDARGKRFSMPVLLLAGGLAVGILAELADAFGADSHEILFSGQAAVPEILAEDSAAIVVLVIVAKAIGYAICLGCGFRGGPVFPAIFL